MAKNYAHFTLVTILLFGNVACGADDRGDAVTAGVGGSSGAAGSGTGGMAGDAAAASSGGASGTAPSGGASGSASGGVGGSMQVSGTGGSGSAAGAGGEQASACQGTEARFRINGGPELLFDAPVGNWEGSVVGAVEPGAWRYFIMLARGAAATADYAPFATFAGHGPTLMGLGGPREMLAENVAFEIEDSLWALDASMTTLGELLCTVPGSGSMLVRNGEDLSFDLMQVAALGTCPGGEAIPGDLQLCMGFACGADQSVTGSLDGVAWTASSGSYQSGPVTKLRFADDSMLRFVTDGAGVGAWGVLATSPRSPYAGAVFCVGAAEVKDEVHWTFSELSRLGTCSGSGSKSVAGCARPPAFQ